MNGDIIEITESLHDGKCRFTVKGRIDSNSADILLRRLEKALKNGQKIIILNMSQVDYISSIGIMIILKIYKQVDEAEGKFNIEKPSEFVKKILDMVALKEKLVIN